MRKERVKIKLHKGGRMPVKGSEKATCHDVYSRKIERVHPWLVKVHLGISIEPPEGYGVKMYSRSSLGKTPWFLSNCIGIGDEDYRGEYIALFKSIFDGSCLSVGDKIYGINTEDLYELNINYDHYMISKEASVFPYEVGDRVAQFEIQERIDLELEQVQSLSQTERGIGGFGSTKNK